MVIVVGLLILLLRLLILTSVSFAELSSADWALFAAAFNQLNDAEPVEAMAAG